MCVAVVGLPATGFVVWGYSQAMETTTWRSVFDDELGLEAQMQGDPIPMAGVSPWSSIHVGYEPTVGYEAAPQFTRGTRYGVGRVKVPDGSDYGIAQRLAPADRADDIAQAVAPSDAIFYEAYQTTFAGLSAWEVDWEATRHAGFAIAAVRGRTVWLIWALEPLGEERAEVTRFLDSLRLGY